MISIRRTSAENPDFCSLIELLDKDLWNRYPETQQNFTAFNVVKLDAKVIVAYDDDRAVGCGCFREIGNKTIVEIKRMYVKEEVRGKGIAKSILIELEKWAIEEGRNSAILETGINQPEAISLYKKLGYEQIEKYEPYVNSNDSICMGKELSEKFS
ncbi:Ribosomal protein S18 acetylase RimI [Paenibacillus sp. yr247]|uniref:GNAT family N-acetyltransferase n=1 Tax=Paenibacillus sp. yr247 TaxID=1761880 RepID=UPI00087F7CCF|nr:GNAT family N-acetyltransferase [Paenibacillus sp. yr247]SDN04736.1 Ribosomal protein S18 acetylase RimI [Paenibacillus sp. yr247]